LDHASILSSPTHAVKPNQRGAATVRERHWAISRRAGIAAPLSNGDGRGIAEDVMLVLEYRLLSGHEPEALATEMLVVRR
jgi:hypothetical protein